MSAGQPGAQPGAAPSLDAVRRRIDEIDGELLRLIDERSTLARDVAAAKQAAAARTGEPVGFGLRPGRETAVLRGLLSRPRRGASAGLVVRIWRELMGDSLANQGPFQVTVWPGRETGRMVELARRRFGGSPGLSLAARPEDALTAARSLGGVAVCALAPDSAWWGRLLAEPSLRVFAVLPCLDVWGPASALAVSAVEVEPTGDDRTFWVTDAPGAAGLIVEALARDGVAADLVVESGGLKLFVLAGFYQADDARLARAPGRLSGVIGAAPAPLDV